MHYGSIESVNHLYVMTGSVYYTGSMVSATWKGGSKTWSNSGTNWTNNSSGSTYTWENEETIATFNASTGTAIKISGKVIAHGLTINSGATGYVFNSGTASNSALTITAGGLTAHESVTFNSPVYIGAPQTWTVDSGKSLNVGNIHTIISDTTISNAGSVYFNGSIDGGGVLNTYRATPGTIICGGSGSFNFAVNASVNVEVVNSTTGEINISTASGLTRTWASVISGSGSGPIRKADPGTLVMSGSSTYTAATQVTSGVLSVGSLAANGSKLPTSEPGQAWSSTAAPSSTPEGRTAPLTVRFPSAQTAESSTRTAPATCSRSASSPAAGS